MWGGGGGGGRGAQLGGGKRGCDAEGTVGVIPYQCFIHTSNAL